MNAAEFLTEMLPHKGFICIAHPPLKYPANGKARGMSNVPFSTFKDAASYAVNRGETVDVYVALFTFPETYEKIGKAGNTYPRIERTQANAGLTRLAWADLDVGESTATEKKYETVGQAITAMWAFCDDIGLPRPMLVNSGYGVHCYWRFDRNLPRAEWQPIADLLKRVFAFKGVLADPKVTADAARVLRVVGTRNHKYGEAKRVRAPQGFSEPISVAVFLAILQKIEAEMPVSGAAMAFPAGIAPPAAVPETPENVEAVRGMLAAIPPDIERGSWMKGVWGVAALGWTCGQELARTWSAEGETFTEEAFATMWGSYDPTRQGGIGVGTLVRLAIEHGYVGPNLTARGSEVGFQTASAADTPGPGAPLTDAVADVANGQRFAAAARGRLLSIHDDNCWLKFDAASGWTRAAMVEVEAFAKGVVGAMHQKAAELYRANHEDPEARRMRQNVERVSRLPHLRAMIAMAKSEPGMSASLAEFDADPWLLGAQNGVLDLRTGELRQATPDLRVSKRCRVEFDPAAECPRFRAFLAEVLPDPEVQGFVLRFMGYCLTGSVEAQAFLFLHGGGFNGKSVLVDLLAWLLGDYARKIPTEMLMLQHRSTQGPDPDILMLKGLRLAYASETEDGRRLSEARVKDMTGGERLSGRAPHAVAAVEFAPTHKLIVSGNHKPSISDRSHGMWRRVILLLFGVQIPETARDPDLSAKLRGEGPGILNAALAGLHDWRGGRDLRVPASIKAVTATYKAEEDILGEFLADECETGEGFKAPRNELNAAYGVWCTLNRHKPLGASRLTKELGERGFHRDAGRRSFLGLRLASSAPPTPRSS